MCSNNIPLFRAIDKNIFDNLALTTITKWKKKKNNNFINEIDWIGVFFADLKLNRTKNVVYILEEAVCHWKWINAKCLHYQS